MKRSLLLVAILAVAFTCSTGCASAGGWFYRPSPVIVQFCVGPSWTDAYGYPRCGPRPTYYVVGGVSNTPPPLPQAPTTASGLQIWKPDAQHPANGVDCMRGPDGTLADEPMWLSDGVSRPCKR
jgi:hypothetical protein